jgi:hypothetical protein
MRHVTLWSALKIKISRAKKLYITEIITEFISIATKGNGKGKDKAVPLQALTGPEGSRRLMLPDFKTIGT